MCSAVPTPLPRLPWPGWDTTSSCDDGSPISAISVGVGEVVTCTFSNVKQSTIIVKKATTGTTGTFTFTGAVPGSITTTTTNGVASGTPLTGTFVPGTYSVAETPVAGWDTTASCDDGSAINAIGLSAGETVTCTFSNVKRGTIVVKKATTGTTGTFAFSGAVSGSITTTTADGTASGGQLTSSVKPGTYSVAEAPVDGWDTTATCDDGSPVGAIVVSANETVTCTFFNVKKGGIIIKKATAGDVGTFTFTGTVPGSITTTSTNGQPSGPVLSANVAPGTYAVAETPVAGWDTTSSCSDGSSVDCHCCVGQRDGHLHVRQHQAGHDHRSQGHGRRTTGTFAFTGAVAGQITTTTSHRCRLGWSAVVGCRAGNVCGCRDAGCRLGHHVVVWRRFLGRC